MKRRILTGLFIAATSVLSACGGGGGGGGFTPGPGPSPTQTPTNNTTAQATLVDDPSGAPLAGVTVRLAPWQWGNGPISGTAPLYTPPPNIVPGPSPTPIVMTTTDPQGHFTISAPNGTYLLVIGSDSGTDTTRPTIHDKVVLSGQTVLVAPTMPPVPGITPAPVEMSGSYRLVTIDQTNELPCIQRYQSDRAAHNLANAVVDEWLTENVRAAVNQSITTYRGQTSSSNTYGFLSTGNATQSGGSSCVTMADSSFTFTNASTFAMQSPWYAGSYLPGGNPSLSEPAYGASEFPVDPRLFKDPNVPNWP